MKNQYQLIAFDMDGTLLTTDKKIAPETTRAMQEAVQAGKQIVLSTGRTDAELADYRSALADVRYGILESGGLLYDFHERRILSCKPIAPEYVQKILELSEQEDVMIQVMAGGKVYIQTRNLDNMAHYQLAYFYPLFSTTALLIDDIRAWLREGTLNGTLKVDKINLYHTDTEARKRTLDRGKDLPLELVYSEITSIEFSPKGVSKGTALIELAGLLGVPVEQTIAVGDADNDLAMLKCCGLAVAMGNANENVKQTAAVVVADNDHDGCAEAIRRYLL